MRKTYIVTIRTKVQLPNRKGLSEYDGDITVDANSKQGAISSVKKVYKGTVISCKERD